MGSFASRCTPCAGQKIKPLTVFVVENQLVRINLDINLLHEIPPLFAFTTPRYHHYCMFAKGEYGADYCAARQRQNTANSSCRPKHETAGGNGACWSVCQDR